MVKIKSSKGKKVKGCDYVDEDEEYDKKQILKQGKQMRTAGIAKELKFSQNDQGYSKQPRIKPQKKNSKPTTGKKKIY